MRKALAASFVFLLAMACSESLSPTDPTVATSGRVVVTVLEAGSQAGIQGAAVEIGRLEKPASFVGKTDGSGVAAVSVTEGTYWIRVVPPAGYSLTGGSAEFLRASVSVANGTQAGLILHFIKS